MSTVGSWGRHLAPNPLECAFLTLSHWAFKQIEGGRPTDEIIREIVEGNECYAVLGLSLMLALETFHASETTLPIVTCQRLWRHDISRLAQEPTRDIDLFGLGSMPRLTSEQAEAKEYLATRTSRTRGVRELVMRFALGPDENLRLRIKEALARFPDDLPHEIEETCSDRAFTDSLKEEAKRHVGLGDIANYRTHTTEDEETFIYYQSPVPATPEQTQKIVANAVYLQEMAVLGWARKSLVDNALADDMALADAIALAPGTRRGVDVQGAPGRWGARSTKYDRRYRGLHHSIRRTFQSRIVSGLSMCWLVSRA